MPEQSKYTNRCPYIVKQNGKIMHCIKVNGHAGAHQHAGEGKWHLP